MSIIKIDNIYLYTSIFHDINDYNYSETHVEQHQNSEAALNWINSQNLNYTHLNYSYIPQHKNIFENINSWFYNNILWVMDTLKIRCLSSSTFDEVTIVKLRDGTNIINGFLTNEKQMVPTLADGTGYSLDSAGGIFKVFSSTIDITTNTFFSIADGIDNGTVYTKTQNGLTFRVNKTNGTYDLIEDSSFWTTDTETFKITATYNGVVVDKLYTISKAKADITGENAQYVIVNAEQTFKYLLGSSTPTNDSITLTAELFGGLTTYNWKYWDGINWVDLAGVNDHQTYVLRHDDKLLDIKAFPFILYDEIDDQFIRSRRILYGLDEIINSNLVALSALNPQIIM